MIGFGILIVILVIVAPIASLIWAGRLSSRIGALTTRVAQLERELSGARRSVGVPVDEAKTDISEATPVPVEAEPEVRDTAETPETTSIDEAAEKEPAPQTPWELPETVQASDAVIAEPAPGKEKPAWEERLASSWMVWLGGITVALAAVFLFNYAIEQGYLTPLTRVVLGLVGGGLLLSGGEWTQRRPLNTGAVVRADYVPPALSAAGIFAILASLFSAHALYGLI